MIVVVSGATGGHLYPALAIVSGLNHPTWFMVSRDHPSSTILAPYGYPMTVFSGSSWSVVRWIGHALRIAWLLFKIKPSVLLLMGGGICFPVALIGALFRIPMVSFEQNTIPGRATRATQWLVSHIITSFKSTQHRLQCKKKVRCLGNPIRNQDPGPSDIPPVISNMTGPTLLVMGGSQGARSLNQFVWAHVSSILLQGINVIHLTGDRWSLLACETHNPHHDVLVSCINDHTLVGHGHQRMYVAMHYIQAMTTLFNHVTHVLCRSGATTLWELDAYGLPCILVPFPASMDNHQHENAIEFARDRPNVHVILDDQLTWQAVKMVMGSPSFHQTRPPVSHHHCRQSIAQIIQPYLSVI